MQRIIRLLKQDKCRLQALQCVQQLGLPQCYLAAGFVRNLVWDHLHHYSPSTPLSDVDVIYFDAHESSTDKYQEYELILHRCMPQLNWQVRNQAKMHVRNGDRAYKSTLDAISYWSEKETAIAVQALISGEIQCIAAFGVDSLFNLQISHNPKRAYDTFKNRVDSKGWLAQWPNLTLLG